MTNLTRSNVAPTAPTQQLRKGRETMKSITLKSLVAVPAIVFVLAASSVATAADGPFEGAANGPIYQHSVQGIDYVWPYTLADAETKAVANLNAWKNQHPNCYVISEVKTFDWVMVVTQMRPRCTITITFEVWPWN